MPRVHAAEVFGPLKAALQAGPEGPVPVAAGPTVAVSAGTPISTYQALKALEVANGSAEPVADDRAILEAQRQLAKTEGVFAEPSSALAVAAAAQLRARGLMGPGDTVVCVLTATGLKQTEALTKGAEPVVVIGPEPGELARVFGERS